jgi:hypothetical protein
VLKKAPPPPPSNNGWLRRAGCLACACACVFGRPCRVLPLNTGCCCRAGWVGRVGWLARPVQAAVTAAQRVQDVMSSHFRWLGKEEPMTSYDGVTLVLEQVHHLEDLALYIMIRTESVTEITLHSYSFQTHHWPFQTEGRFCLCVVGAFHCARTHRLRPDLIMYVRLGQRLSCVAEH